MRIIILALSCLLLCTSCGFGNPVYSYYAPTMSFELVENNGWKLITPSREWVLGVRRALFPQYFSSEAIGVLCGEVYNYFYTTYQLDADSELVIFINYPAAFLTRKFVHSNGEEYVSEYGNNEDNCARDPDDTSKTVIMIYRVNAELDNTSVYFLQGARKIQGLEYDGIPGRWWTGKELEPTVYDLSPKLVYPYGPDKPYLSTVEILYFSFEHMTCQDYEDAVFVIDGFYYQGKQLPPLKVRLKYYDYGAVPEYIGPETLPVR